MAFVRLNVRRALATAAAGGALLLLAGCDETIQTTIEDGIINTSSTLVSAITQALIAAAVSPTGG